MKLSANIRDPVMGSESLTNKSFVTKMRVKPLFAGFKLQAAQIGQVLKKSVSHFLASTWDRYWYLIFAGIAIG